MKNGARPKSRNGGRAKTHSSYSSNNAENAMSRLEQQIADFEEFKATVLPALQKDVKNGMSAKEIREKYTAMIQARLITDALTTKDAGKAAFIGKDVLDRAEGKATEKKVVTHKFADMKEEEIDAVLKSEIEELEDMEARFEQ